MPGPPLPARAPVAVVAALSLLAAVAAVAAGAWWVRSRSTPLEGALAVLPAPTLRTSYTDWAVVGRTLGDPPGVDAGAGEIRRFLDRAFDEDLTVASALAESAEGLQDRLGVSLPAALWEVYGQSRTGSVAALRLAEDADLAAVADRLREAGYDEPGSPGGVWRGTPDLVVQVDPSFSPLQENLALLEEERLVLMSDDADYLATVLDVVGGAADALLGVDGVEELAGAGAPDVGGAAGAAGVAGPPAGSGSGEEVANAVLWAGDFACQDLAMSTADPADVAEGDRLVAEAGDVSPLDGLLMAQRPDGRLAVAMWFESAEAAAADLQPRVDLASGAAPGQGGSFPDRFRVTAAESHGRRLTMTFTPRDGPVFADVSSGPVLFATC